MKNLRFILLIAGLLSLSGCGLYKKYERPQTEFADSLYRRLPEAKDTVSIASVSWQDFFTDPVLKEWIDLGLKNNTDLNVARFKVEEAEAALMAARGAFLPGVSFGANGGTDFGGGTDFKANVSASWEVDIFGSLTNARERQQPKKRYSLSMQKTLKPLMLQLKPWLKLHLLKTLFPLLPRLNKQRPRNIFPVNRL